MASEASGPFAGVIAPVATPFDENGEPDLEKFVEHAKWLLEDGCHALAPFGTTSEGNSIGIDERMEMLEELVSNGIAGEKLMPGTGMCAISDAVMLTQHAADLGCAGVLMLPPFYYKNPSDDALFRFFANVIEEAADGDLSVYLYHIPQMSSVGFSLDLIGKLRDEFPETVVGLKDSSGDWSNMEAILEAFPDFDLFPGSEGFLLKGLRQGAAGTISASANINARAMRQVYDAFMNDDVAGAERAQAGLSEFRAVVQSQPLIPVIKAVIAHFRDDPLWAVPLPPLDALDRATAEQVLTTLKRDHDFKMNIAIDV